MRLTPVRCRLEAACVVAAIVATQSVVAAHGEPIAEGKQAMVVSRHPEASRVGREVLRAGGNAVDAAVAVSMALAVVLPQAGNLGGGGFLLFRRASDGFTTCVDFRETAPAAAHRDVYMDASGRLDTLRARVGHQSVGVPGTVAGLQLAWSKYGRKPWAELIEPAVELAERGFAANQELAEAVHAERDKLQRFPATAAVLLPGGRPLQPGRKIKQPDLARTLRSIASAGAPAFYTGEIAALLLQEMGRGSGWITRDDLAGYQAIEREPVRGRHRELEILCAPPPSSGGVTVLEILGMLEGVDLHSVARPALGIHFAVEAMSRAFADRNAYLADPAFVRVPVQALLSPAYLQHRRSAISADRATPARFVRPGDFSRFEWPAMPVFGDSTRAPARGPIAAEPVEPIGPPASATADSTAAVGEDATAATPDSARTDTTNSTTTGFRGSATAETGDSTAADTRDSTAAEPRGRHESDETTHFSIVDPEGNVVSMSTTLNGNFGSGVIVEGAGFLLNNEMDDFEARPGEANQYGLVGGEANAIAPGKRMLSSMSPTIVLRDGRPWLVLGARGGPRILTTVVQIILNVHDFGMDLAQAVAAKRYHHQWLPDVVWYEDGALTGEVQEHLWRLGHELRPQAPRRSSAQCIEITPEGLLRGVSDPRTQGGAAGF